MATGKCDALSDVAKGLGEKAPGSIKEITKVLVELTTKFVDALTELRCELKKVDSSNTVIQEEITSVKASMKFINDSFEEFRADVKGFRQELTEAKKQTLEVQKESTRVVRELKEVKRELVELKQYSRRANLEVKGIPMNDEDDLDTIFTTMASCLETDVSVADVDVIHRVPTRKPGPPNSSARRAPKTLPSFRPAKSTTAKPPAATAKALIPAPGQSAPRNLNPTPRSPNKPTAADSLPAKQITNDLLLWKHRTTTVPDPSLAIAIQTPRSESTINDKIRSTTRPGLPNAKTHRTHQQHRPRDIKP
ncbi:hypothetical protein HPB48_022006 [Haemaphysalis longicornis]|uniref:Uncharacterized protein n=1 Tax=Haemaphysalis longicornis TaxID=44386 RepID=A0A9J6GYU4_HAELO|nr:hypothetical protein HPB48_022006 [Haemaphysalis longicornis]